MNKNRNSSSIFRLGNIKAKNHTKQRILFFDSFSIRQVFLSYRANTSFSDRNVFLLQQNTQSFQTAKSICFDYYSDILCINNNTFYFFLDLFSQPFFIPSDNRNRHACNNIFNTRSRNPYTICSMNLFHTLKLRPFLTHLSMRLWNKQSLNPCLKGLFQASNQNVVAHPNTTIIDNNI